MAGTRPFIIKEKRRESELMHLFRPGPTDGNPVFAFQTGAISPVSSWFIPPSSITGEIRQYSPPDAPMAATTASASSAELRGQASNLLRDHLHIGDTVDIMPPARRLLPARGDDTPVVLISPGSALTPC